MSTKTSLLGLTKPAYTDAADVNVLNTNFDLIDKAIGNGARVENLLVNSWFVNPINQRGQTSYTSVTYGIDRWQTNMGRNMTVTVGDGKVTLSKKNSGGDYKQVLPVDLTGKTMTYALKTSEGITCISAVISDSSTLVQIGSLKAYLSVYALNGTTIFRIYFNDASEINLDLYWAALYEGSYTIDTLPKYQPKARIVEMYDCGVSLNPVNLLDNSDFRNPINQWGIASGGTAAAWGYCIDRWLNFSNSSGTMTFTSDGIRYTFSNLNQPIPPSVKTGTVVTAAAYWSDGTLLIANGTITRGTAWTWFCSASAYDGRKIGVVDNGNGSSVHFRIDGSEGTTLVWAALYEGTYTADTLPTYQPKERVVELYNCDVPLQPCNELDNSDFTPGRLINQRGATSATSDSVYIVDRWIANISNNRGGISVGSGGITLTPVGDDYSGIYQRMEHYAQNKGKTYTVAVCVNGVWECKTFALGGLPGGHLFGNGLMLFSVDNMDVLFRAYSNHVSTVTIQRIALYEGAYTAETLPVYQYKGYAAELAECQRYYRDVFRIYGESVGSVIRESIMLNPPMRIAPTVTKTQGWEGNANSGYTVNAISAKYIDIQYSGWGNVTLALSADL